MSGSAAIRIPSCAGVSWRAPWVAAGAATGRWRDKGRTVRFGRAGCFVHIFGAFRTVRRWRAPCASRPSS